VGIALPSPILARRRGFGVPRAAPPGWHPSAVRQEATEAEESGSHPQTVIAWHGQGFRLFWTWKVRHGQAGRPAVSREVRDPIRQMSRENPLWCAPRIHGELLKPGIDIGETSAGKYMVRGRKPPSQTWRTFLFQVLYVFLVSATAPHGALQLHRALHRRMDCPATAKGLPR
jgi:hypothetical protein